LSQGFVDLHCHYVPAVDDGVRTQQEGVELCRALKQIGYATVAATPHIRSGMFENRKAQLVSVFEAFSAQHARGQDMPELLLGAEHFCDDVFWALFERGEALPYTGDKALLIELPPESLPLGLEDRIFRMRVRGLQPVIAHPERYTPMFGSSAPLARLVELGAVALLDLMSLTGKYGRKPQRAAERMLKDELYYAACSDCHRPADVPIVQQAIERLTKLTSPARAQALLADHPRRILRGEVEA
jgi:protein-tyrosine phosphatase